MTPPMTLFVPRMGPWWEGSDFCVRAWAPEHKTLALLRYGSDGQKVIAETELQAEPNGFFSARISHPTRPLLYKIRIDGEGPFPDPWSREQPFGVHGPSSLLHEDFAWRDSGWRGVPVEDLLLYELHVGTATAEGTFDALIPMLAELRALGVTALELLPLATFPGSRNWGYDGTYWFAPAACYGGPQGLKRLVNAAHAIGLGVIVDAVYNHFGPEGNYLRAYTAAYFTDKHKTPWGDAIDYDGPQSQVTRELALSNAEMWVREYHVDGLRLDATHAIIDDSQPHLISALNERARKAAPGRTLILMAEDERNDGRLVTSIERGGYGLDGVWADDFHHQMRRAFAGDSEGYFGDYSGSTQDLVATLNEGWFYHGQYSANLGKQRGTDGYALPSTAFIYCIQNHDQIGNRPLGNRLGEDVSPAAFRAMSAVLLFSPYTPLLFVGQEWNARTPFLYFTDLGPELGRSVTEGRRREFEGFAHFHKAEIPDPQAVETFLRSKLNFTERNQPENQGVLALYKTLIGLRQSHPALRSPTRLGFRASVLSEQAFIVERGSGSSVLRLGVVMRGKAAPPADGAWRMLLHTEEPRFGGAGQMSEGPCAYILEQVV